MSFLTIWTMIDVNIWRLLFFNTHAAGIFKDKYDISLSPFPSKQAIGNEINPPPYQLCASYADHAWQYQSQAQVLLCWYSQSRHSAVHARDAGLKSTNPKGTIGHVWTATRALLPKYTLCKASVGSISLQYTKIKSRHTDHSPGGCQEDRLYHGSCWNTH